MKKDVFYSLLNKYLEGKASVEEELLLKKLFDDAGTLQKWDEERMGVKTELESKMLERLTSSIQEDQDYSPRPVFMMRHWRGIAAALFLCAVSAIFLVNQKERKGFSTTSKSASQAIKNDIAPSSGKAILTLADGSKISLNDIEKGTIAQQGNTVITKTGDGQLVYKSQAGKIAGPQMNTISTPSGGSYYIVLPDGTKVWMNAASNLKFPAAFNDGTRSVELQGEAYFEVSKVTTRGKVIPFFVKTPDSEIKVLGTHFNVMAYPEDGVQQTTLFEGSVIVSSKAKNKYKEVTSTILKPGQQAVIKESATGIMVLNNPNMEAVLAWKSGVFMFNSMRIEAIMRQIGRWYDAEIVYEGEHPDATFTGLVPRSSYVSKLLKVLEGTGAVKFRIEGHKIIVKKT